jgi:hypothetical protein
MVSAALLDGAARHTHTAPHKARKVRLTGVIESSRGRLLFVGQPPLRQQHTSLAASR